MRALVIGSDGFIGRALCATLRDRGHQVCGTSRRSGAAAWQYDLVERGPLPPADVTYLCAAKTRFLDCESSPDAYCVNVDAPREIAKKSEHFVFLSSEAVERAIHTAYGLHNALAEATLAHLPNALIVRLSRVTSDNLKSICEQLVDAGVSRSTGLLRICR